MAVQMDTSARLETFLLTGHTDQVVVAVFYTLTAAGTVLDTAGGDIMEDGRVYSPLDLRQYASFDAEMRQDADSGEGVTLVVTMTEASPWNELTFALSEEDAGTMQGWGSRRGVGSLVGVTDDGTSTALGQWRWQMRRPSARRA